ncbi:hypothetical protein EDB92DRAFT_113649 [Lactarius akahatsu]|uniref:Uncharacterized protein n=1 Tax=Lactarius akahatsu TaxID=416441 RepID=A0AAD4LL97_9AGAM|nr:hypothetical protein EDB92DRAFT_113649 [Lactarius akahatsu]
MPHWAGFKYVFPRMTVKSWYRAPISFLSYAPSRPLWITSGRTAQSELIVSETTQCTTNNWTVPNKPTSKSMARHDFAFTSFVKSREYEGHPWTYGLQQYMRSQVGRSTTYPRRIRCRPRSPHRSVDSRGPLFSELRQHMAVICVALLLLTRSLVGCESYMQQNDLRL